MEHTVSDANRRPDESARMEPGGSGDMERRQPVPGPELVLARRHAGALARPARRVDFTVHPIAVAPREAAEGGRRA
ncbi:hypothetical protein [Bifidobacterium thermophilum]|uniref:Uncharacterized protein n=1 Tax=Bifidobacterium thermophilum TaxID=33905 RepID=A0A7X9NQA1_9BIFI|nr:hypothetical protein [Bifidobacterium thermophilum]NME61839.1 hypothetical protein [Bifidobacterium thermophilum]